MSGSPARIVGALEIGGSHITSALVDDRLAHLQPGTLRRRAIAPGAPARDLVRSFVAAITDTGAAPDTGWAIAIPGPFDYSRGIGMYTKVGKFDALLGVNLDSALHASLPNLSGPITFVNDADAFAVGEWRQGVAAGATRCVGLTLGSGIGSAFLHDGHIITSGPSVPPHGRAHLLKIGTADLEDVVSRRAILARYLTRSRGEETSAFDVHDIFTRSRRGDDWATQVLHDAFSALGGALAPWLTRFHPTVIAVGGGMSGSWDLIAPSLQQGLTAAGSPPDIELLPSTDTERSALIGAVTHTHHSPG